MPNDPHLKHIFSGEEFGRGARLWTVATSTFKAETYRFLRLARPTADEASASTLFSPLAVGPLTLRTRTWIPAMVPWRSNEDGDVTPEVLEWYQRRFTHIHVIGEGLDAQPANGELSVESFAG